MSKLNSRFAFPEVLDLSKLCGVEHGDGVETVYDLQSVVIHMGQYGVGHYCKPQREAGRVTVVNSFSTLPL